MPRVLQKPFLAPLLVVLLYVAAMGVTSAHFMADSGGYVVSILSFAGVDEFVKENPSVRDYRAQNSFWDFGHLLWRPLGLLAYKVLSPVSSLVVGPDPALNVYFLLMSLNFLAGLVSVILLYALIQLLTERRWIAFFVTACFILSNGFLNFTQTGSSYIAGLCFVLVALYLLVKDKGELRPRTAVLAGLACAAAITLWVPYVLVLPGTIATPLVLFGWNTAPKRSLVYAVVAFVVATAVAFLAVMLPIGVHTPADLRDWIAASSHGVQISGLARMLLGFARSFIHLGNDGILFKRFLLHDSLNPVTAFDLVRVSLWKLGLFYLMLASLGLSLLVRSSRRMLVLLLLTAGPLILFAIKFDGGAVERYLPVYPVFFVAVAWTLSSAKVPRVLKIMPVVFLGLAVLVNTSVMARMVLDKQNQRTVERLHAVIPHLQPNNSLVTTHLQDDLVNFQASFPFAPINRHDTYHVYPLVWMNTAQAGRWRQEFADHALETWSENGDVWVSTRLLSTKPEASWNWVEGDDPRVRWNDLQSFFTQLQTCGTATGGDGFVQLSQSEANINFLKSQTDQVAINSVSTKDCR
jgi:hypothetical protein